MTTPPSPDEWLPRDWAHPLHVPVGAAHHLRPLLSSDAVLDLHAVRGSRRRLWSVYGPVWNWPPADLDLEHEVALLTRYEAETHAHESFTYALFDTDETALLGHLYLDPATRPGADADVSWWVVDELVGGAVEAELDALVPVWVARVWPLRRPRYLGQTVSWDAWAELPELLP